MMFCVLGMFAMYMVDCLIFSPSSQKIWIYCALAVYFLSHAFFWLRKQIARKNELQRIARMGRVDDQLCELLRAHGIVFNASGAIANPALYYSMMDDADELDKEEDGRRGSALQEQLENVAMGSRRRTSIYAAGVSNGPNAVAPVREAWGNA